MDTVSIKPIGIIHSPFKELRGMPIQPKGASGITGTININLEYSEGLSDIEGFSHIYLIYYFHQSPSPKMMVKPFMDDVYRGVFSTRAPVRPAKIGLSVVELISISKNVLTVRGIDVLDGTPLLDIKPYIEKFDHPDKSTSGWMQSDEDSISARRSDNRFI